MEELNSRKVVTRLLLKTVFFSFAILNNCLFVDSLKDISNLDSFEELMDDTSIDSFTSKSDRSNEFDPSEELVLGLPAGWVDPFDMSIDKISPEFEDPFDVTGDKVRVFSLNDYKTTKHSSDKYESYFQRFVNLLLRGVTLGSSTLLNSETQIVKFEFVIKKDDLNKLQDFAEKGKNSGINIEMISNILGKVLPRKPENEPWEFSFVWKNVRKTVAQFIASPQWTIVSTCFLMFLMTLWFTKTHSYRMALLTLFITVFLCGFGFNWMKLYEEKEVERYVDYLLNSGGAPHHCSGKTLAWYEHVFYNMFGDDCYDFYKARDVSPMIKVSPAEVFSETISSMIIRPSANIGKAYGNFVSSVSESVPFWLKPIAVVLGFILPLGFLIVILCFLFSYKLSISPFGFCIEPGRFTSLKSEYSYKQKEKYIEDISHQNNCDSEKNKNGKRFCTDNCKPVFLMKSLLGLKKTLPTGTSENTNIIKNNMTQDVACESVAKEDYKGDNFEEPLPTNNKTDKSEIEFFEEEYCFVSHPLKTAEKCKTCLHTDQNNVTETDCSTNQKSLPSTSAEGDIN